MMTNLLVIDDDRVEHVLLSRIVRSVDPEIEIRKFTYAEEALVYLRSPDRPIPRAIFVDIDMPRMDGFAFVEAYDGLYPELKGPTQIWMMSNSIDPRDRERAENSASIMGYIEKSSSKEVFAEKIRLALHDTAQSAILDRAHAVR